MSRKRILVVDDSCMYQRILSDVIDSHPSMQVVGVAGNGKVALEMVDSLKPDLLTLDILMPELDGIQTLIRLRRDWPSVRTIMVSSLTTEGSEAALDALALGAHDYTVKPASTGGVSSIREALGKDLLPRIEALCGIDPHRCRAQSSTASSALPSIRPVAIRTHALGQAIPKIVCIGVSTGGPDALTKLLMQMPHDLEVPVCIVQHMPREFTGKLAARLDEASALCVCEAKLGDRLQAGTVYIAPGDYHMVLDRVGPDVLVNLNRNPPENSCRPSVDPLFRSAAAIHGAHCLGVIMTGMGQDGLNGAEVLVAAGSPVLVQDEASCVVWGMPRLVAQAGLAAEQVPLDSLAGAIIDRVRGAGSAEPANASGKRDGAANAASHDHESHHHESLRRRRP